MANSYILMKSKTYFLYIDGTVDVEGKVKNDLGTKIKINSINKINSK